MSSSVLISGQYWSYQKNIGHIKLIFQMFGKHSTVRPYQLGLFVGGDESFLFLIKTFIIWLFRFCIFFLNSALLVFVFPGICTFKLSFLFSYSFHCPFNFSRVKRSICSFLCLCIESLLIFSVNIMKSLPFCWSLKMTIFGFIDFYIVFLFFISLISALIFLFSFGHRLHFLKLIS